MKNSYTSFVIGVGFGFFIGNIALRKYKDFISKKNNAVPKILIENIDDTKKKNICVGVVKPTEKNGFIKVFDELTSEMVEDLEFYGLKNVSSSPIRRMLEYNVPGGKLNRGLTVVQATETILGTKVESEILKKAAVLGWCIEWMQASFLVADDLMDASLTRRGQPCWYKNSDIGLIAVNDTIILMTQIDILLHKYFGNDPSMFMQLHRVLTETAYQTELGQSLDLTTQPPQGPIDLSLYTEERHRLIVEYKTAYYSFYCPIALALILTGKGDHKTLDICKEICVKMGIYFQVQDDYLDCYGSPEQIGKIGTDIQDSKCGWLVVQALQIASDAQCRIIHDNYGKDDPISIEKIKTVYTQLNLEEKFKAYEEESYKSICHLIESKVQNVPKNIYYGLLNKIYKRSK